MVYSFVLQLTPTLTYRGPFLSSRAGSRAPPLRLRTPTLLHRKLHPNQVSPSLAGGSAAPSFMNMCSSFSRERRGWAIDIPIGARYVHVLHGAGPCGPGD